MSASQDVRLNPVAFADWQLLPQRAIWWPLRSMLIVSDLHLGKAAHFRKHGIAVPNAVNADTLQRLDQLITQFKPRNVLVLGDLFHSEENEEWQEFRAWLMDCMPEASCNRFASSRATTTSSLLLLLKAYPWNDAHLGPRVRLFLHTTPLN